MYRIAIFEFNDEKPFSRPIALIAPSKVQGEFEHKGAPKAFVWVQYPEFVPVGEYSFVIEREDRVDGFIYTFAPCARIERTHFGFILTPTPFVSRFTLKEGVEEAYYVVVWMRKRLSLSSPTLMIESGIWTDKDGD